MEWGWVKLKEFVWGGPDKYLSESEISDDETARDLNNDGNIVDAVMGPPMPRAEAVVTLEAVHTIEQQLDEFEMVGLMYLLYESSLAALDVINAFTNSNRNDGLIYQWVHSEGNNNKWQKKLVEALCIIQNYKVLKALGFDKRELQHAYLPSQDQVASFVSKRRKLFYRLSEKLTKRQTAQFLDNMKVKLARTNVATPNFSPDYLELYFLYWENCGVNDEHIRQVFKGMNLEHFSDQILTVSRAEVTASASSRTKTTKDNTFQQGGWDKDYSLATSAPLSLSQEGPMADSYDIDPNCPGVVLIINQEEFYTETDLQYKDLLHERNDEVQLERREGTKRDKDRLNALFRRMGFTVIVRTNLAHYDMIENIKSATESVTKESSLIVCVLSHGSNGVVYGANSCRVNVDQIQNIMCKKNPNLMGKPKILILQSCQGQRCQRANEDDDDDGNTTDGSTKVRTADLLVFWATIPGYAAIRNKINGSWFIQALCDEIEQGNSKYHLLEICTRANNKVTKREWKEESGINIMTPMVVFTLTKSFYLPPVL